jgi:hypothetical protein
MIRTVWLATICLAVLSALAAGQALRTPADSIVAEAPTDQTLGSSGLAQDTLKKADRLETTYARPELPVHSTLQPAGPIVTAVSSVSDPAEAKIISRHWHDPHAISSSAVKPKQVKQTGTDKKTKTVDRKGDQAADRSKPTVPMKPCRPRGFGDLLRSLNLSPACDS